MKDDKMILIAYHLLESSICAYIEWLVNELIRTANKIEYKDARLEGFFIGWALVKLVFFLEQLGHRLSYLGEI